MAVPRKRKSDGGWKPLLEARYVDGKIEVRIRGGEVLPMPENKTLTFTYRVRDGVLTEIPKGHA